MAHWKVIGAAVRGPDHEAGDAPCQDAFRFRVDGRRVIAVVADGAGSARFSDEGAARLCEAVTAALAGCDAPVEAAASERYRDCAEAAINIARSELLEMVAERAAHDHAASLRDYSATMVAVVAEPDAGLFLHIGDGAAAAVAADLDWADATVSRPENGEFANETWFFTCDDWRERLRVTDFGPATVIALVSDGAMGFAFAERLAGLEPRFMAPVTKFLRAADGERGARALAATLERPDARSISGDDKTVVWIGREPVS